MVYHFGLFCKSYFRWFCRRFMMVYYLGLAQSGSCTRSHRRSTAFNIVQNIFRSGGSLFYNVAREVLKIEITFKF